MQDGRSSGELSTHTRGFLSLSQSIARSCAGVGGSGQGPGLSTAGQGHGDAAAGRPRVHFCGWSPRCGRVLSREQGVLMEDVGRSGA